MAVHVYPAREASRHRFRDVDHECPCGPTIEYLDPDTGLPHANGPLVTHHARPGYREGEGAWVVRSVDPEAGVLERETDHAEPDPDELDED